MKSNWLANTDGLIYSGTDFVAYVFPATKYNHIIWCVYFSKGMGSDDRRHSNVNQFASCAHAVDYVEKFFELNISEQREQFDMWCKEV